MEMSQNATVSSTNPKVSSINPTALLTLLFGELHNLKLFRLSKHMQDQDFHLKKTTRFAWWTSKSLLLLHGRPVGQPNGKIRHFHISHNAPYSPPKFCITFVFHFSWVLQPSQEKLKTILMQTFFGGGGGGVGGNKVHYGKCGSVESEKTLGTGLAYMLVLRWKKAKWRMDHPEWIAWTFNPLLKVFYC